MRFAGVSFANLLSRVILVLLLVSFGVGMVVGSVVPSEEASMSQTFYWHRTKHECKHYVLDTSLPLEGKVSVMVSFNPGEYMIIGHPTMYRIHTSPVSEETVIGIGYWNLTLWASNRKADQHFLVSLYVWDSEHERHWSSEEWNTGKIEASSPDDPVELTHSFYVGSLTIPEGGCFGFVIKVGTDSAINYFFDSSIHDSKLVVPASRPFFPGYLLETVTYTSTAIVPILVTQVSTARTTMTRVVTQPVTFETTILEETRRTSTLWVEKTETRVVTTTSILPVAIGIVIAVGGIAAALLMRRRPSKAPSERRPPELF